MFYYIIGLKLLFTVATFSEFVKFLLMILKEVYVVHLLAFIAFFDVSSTVAKMSCHFRLRKRFKAIFAKFCYLLIHFDNNLKYILNYIIK